VKKVVVLDYGSGNLRSAERALARVGAEVTVTADSALAVAADGLVVPGVGAFAACMAGLDRVGGGTIVAKRLAAAAPVLGICVGMQVLFEAGVEHGLRTPGCGCWPGVVERLTAPVLPHMGWNSVAAPADSTLFAGLDPEQLFYFVHSYAVRQAAGGPAGGGGESGGPRVTWATHGEPFVAALEDGPLAATQFHPEKSGDAGAHVLANWLAGLS
jgi:glutamine amidotransferase